ncbi:CPBP family intramembrane glutamic endopeptidase [Maricaulis sp.]|uniref:CPBP family intramembrane glutamic endopeptidase n=1 Tax=Maricaulis sp. TaxID=1486257 RepID=UPI0026068B16|nr:CPBP family intramembrane glutamic endopeptidase [Maricaulis sp.]
MTEQTHSRLRAAIELTAGVTIAFGTKALLDPYIWKFSGPISLAVVLTLATLYLHSRGETWAQLGLRNPGRWKSWALLLPQIVLGVVVILGVGAGTAFLGDTLGLWQTGALPDGVEDRWGNIRGNLPVYLLWLALAWISAGFGEELFFRGFMVSRAERVTKGLPFALFLAVLIPAAIFGIAHFYYQGLRGLIVTGLIGLSLGTLYLLYKRNLWPLIVAHGLVDTLGFTALYLDADW